MAKKKVRSSQRCSIRSDDTPEGIISKIRFLASAGKLDNNRKFFDEERSVTLEELKMKGASFDMMYDFNELAKKEKHYKAIIAMVETLKKYNRCDQSLILEMANSFVREFSLG